MNNYLLAHTICQATVALPCRYEIYPNKGSEFTVSINKGPLNARLMFDIQPGHMSVNILSNYAQLNQLSVRYGGRYVTPESFLTMWVKIVQMSLLDNFQ